MFYGKQKTAYEMRISDWSSDVCYSDLALRQGRVTEAALFDRDYQPIPGSDPQQLLAGCVALTDEVLPAIQEPVLDFSERVVFCACVDVNAYLPTHNLKFGQPQGGDPVWNAPNCRNRRIFNDRLGLAAGRTPESLLLQTYRRDLGGRNLVVISDWTGTGAGKER